MFSDVKPNPIAKNVADGLAVLRAGKHDGVVAIGDQALDLAAAASAGSADLARLPRVEQHHRQIIFFRLYIPFHFFNHGMQ